MYKVNEEEEAICTHDDNCCYLFVCSAKRNCMALLQYMHALETPMPQGLDAERAQERTQDWQRRFGAHLHLTCKELTADSSLTDAQEIDDADIICTTPEKFGAYPSQASLFVCNWSGSMHVQITPLMHM